MFFVINVPVNRLGEKRPRDSLFLVDFVHSFLKHGVEVGLHNLHCNIKLCAF